METLRTKDLAFISGYIRKNYYQKLKNKKSLNHNIIVDNGIMLIIHNYCKPILLTSIDAMSLSDYIYHRVESTWIKEWNDSYISTIKQHPDAYKLVVLGVGAMGKTSLLFRYTLDEIPRVNDFHVPTLFDTRSENIMVDNKSISFSLWDTAGAVDYARLRVLNYAQTHVFMICMSVYDNPADEDNIDKSGMWSNLAVHTMALCQEAKVYCPFTPRVLIGTKTDLREDKECTNMCYTKEEMECFADIWGCHAYFECSALKDQHDKVKEIFESTASIAMKHRKELLNAKKSKKDCIIL